MEAVLQLGMKVLGHIYDFWHRNSPTHVLIDASDHSHGEVNALFLSLYALFYHRFCVKIFIIGDEPKEATFQLDKWHFKSWSDWIFYVLAHHAVHLGIITHVRNVNEAKRALEGRKILSVTALTEQALDLAEEIGIAGRPKETKAARLTKDGFGDAMKKAAKRAPKQMFLKKGSSVSGVMSNFPGKVVLKPVTGSGSEGVSIHDNEASLANAFSALDRDAVVDEFIEGPQYCLLTVSQGKKHEVVGSYEVITTFEDEACKFDRLDMRALTSHAKENEMLSVLEDTLNVVGINCGACNPEIRVGCDSQLPAVIDLNPRLEGASHDIHLLLKECFGRDHNLSLLSSFDGTQNQNIKFAPMKKFGMAVYLRNDAKAGILIEKPKWIDAIKNLESYVGSFWKYPVGSEVKTTVDYGTTLGFALLSNRDEEQLQRDYATVRALGGKLNLQRGVQPQNSHS